MMSLIICTHAGESLPVTKIPLPQVADMKYSPDECKRYTLYNGTEIIQTRTFGHANVLAVVLHTGKYEYVIVRTCYCSIGIKFCHMIFLT